MLLVISLDSESLPWLDEQIESGTLPNLAHFARSARRWDLDAVRLAGIAYPSLYSGLAPADHGLYFPLQWCAEEQRVRAWHDIPYPDTLMERTDRSGVRMVVLDPPECPPLALTNGFAASGVQFRARVLLHPWFSGHADEKLLHPPSPRCDEVFGLPRYSDLAPLREGLLGAPRRLANAALRFLRRDPPDCLWVNCCAMHIAGHQFFDLRLLPESESGALAQTRLEVARGYDAMLGQLLEAAPPGTPVIVFFAKGMGPVTGWVDLLSRMLRRVLGEPIDTPSPILRLRGALPRNFRNWAANLLSEDRAMNLAARLATPRRDWSQTRAFELPSDGPGFIRLNLRGRERFGAVGESDRISLIGEIREGLASFADDEGEPVVDRVVEPIDVIGPGKKLGEYPDLIVYWKPKPTLLGKGVRSQRFGEIRRRAILVGRSGYHCPGAAAWVLPGACRVTGSQDVVLPVDIPATILSALGIPHDDLPGRPLLSRDGGVQPSA